MTRQITIDKTETEGFAARIQNRGQSQGTQTVELYKDGTLVTDEANLTLTPDETAYVLEAPTVFSNASSGQTLTMEVVTDDMTRTVEVFINGIPDSVVSRTNDGSNVLRSDNIGRGLRITTSEEWADRLDVEVSGMTSGIDDAEVYRVSDGSLIGSATGLGGLSGGDQIAIPLNSPLQPDDGSDSTKYNVNLRNADGDFDQGYNSNVTAPIESDDGVLTIVDFSNGPQSTANNASCIVQLGNLGLSL